MNDKIYKIIELTGTSGNSIEEAVNLALERAGQTIHNLGWFQIIETREASRTTKSNTGR
jgi:dodecin